MANTISWLGNPVVDSNTSRRSDRPTTQSYTNQDMQTRIAARDDMPDNGDRQGPPPVTDYSYIPGYLARNIGKNVRAEFSIGNNLYTDKTGRLKSVGVNYFVLEDVNSRTDVMCDLYSVKFVTILPS